MARIAEQYKKEILPALREQFSIKNIMDVPKLEKIVVNMGVGGALQNPKLLDAAMEDMGKITGQKPKLCRATLSVAAFKLREGMPIGCKVTLRGRRMYEFYDRFVAVAVPRIRDFRGFSAKAFDGRGNYSVGIQEQIIFPEIDYDKVYKIRGMNVTVVTTAESDEEGRELLRLMNMPFRR